MTSQPWDMASWRQRTYRSPLRTMHGPVGVRPDPLFRGDARKYACTDCGHHVCSCERLTQFRHVGSLDLGIWGAAERSCFGAVAPPVTTDSERLMLLPRALKTEAAALPECPTCKKHWCDEVHEPKPGIVEWWARAKPADFSPLNADPPLFSTFPCCGKPANVDGHATDCPVLHAKLHDEVRAAFAAEAESRAARPLRREPEAVVGIKPVLAVDEPIKLYCGGCYRVSKNTGIHIRHICCFEPECANYNRVPTAGITPETRAEWLKPGPADGGPLTREKLLAGLQPTHANAAYDEAFDRALAKCLGLDSSTFQALVDRCLAEALR